MRLLTFGHPFAYEMERLACAFFPGTKLEVLAEGDPARRGTVSTRARRGEDGRWSLSVSVNGGSGVESAEERLGPGADGAEAEQALARLLYGLLSGYTGIEPPWGILTGVRPVRLCRTVRERLGCEAAAREALRERCLVRPEKLDLAFEIENRQRILLERAAPRGFSLYIGVPFCPSRCLYCSFVSHDIEGMRKLAPEYVERLCEELRFTGKLAEGLGLTLQAGYIGGGTPTSLEAGQLGRIMAAVGESFDLAGLLEYTVEAGRPDTVTAEKLALIREMGCDRVSINPQTMDDAVLRRIGRGHTAAQVAEAFALARDAGFGCVNADLIAGLPGDSEPGFAGSLERVIALSPENITVHALTVKRSSRLRAEGGDAADFPAAGGMLAHARERLAGAGYAPYYLYRQKGYRGASESLENTGYARPGREGLYNVLIMEEAQTILAAGAGGVTKLVGTGGEVKRVAGFKFPYEYIGRFGEVLARKSEAVSILEDLYARRTSK